MNVATDISLRDVQRELCALFHQRFPFMKASLTINDATYDSFQDMPFAEHAAGSTFAVTFSQTDDPYFYDLADRIGSRVSLEEEMQSDAEVREGATTRDLGIWMRAKREHTSKPDVT